MTYVVTLRESRLQFGVEPGETVLDAALRQHVILPYGCGVGQCGACKGLVVHGQIALRPYVQSALTHNERARGTVLLCCTKPLTDVEIDVSVAGAVQARRLPCRIDALERKADDVMLIRLRLPAREQLIYQAGQYIQLSLPDGTCRSYSIASPPHCDGPLELHVRRVPSGRFTNYVFEKMKQGEMLHFEGPFGTFTLQDNTQKPVVLLASGTGFAPIKAIIEQARYAQNPRTMVLYWGARCEQDLYCRELVDEWADGQPKIRFIPVLSEPDAGDDWQGRRGFVHRAIMEDFPDLYGYQVYACGAPAMIEAARRDFVEHHRLPNSDFYSDAFC